MKLLGVKIGNHRYPKFQIDPVRHEVRPAVASANRRMECDADPSAVSKTADPSTFRNRASAPPPCCSVGCTPDPGNFWAKVRLPQTAAAAPTEPNNANRASITALEPVKPWQDHNHAVGRNAVNTANRRNGCYQDHSIQRTGCAGPCQRCRLGLRDGPVAHQQSQARNGQRVDAGN